MKQHGAAGSPGGPQQTQHTMKPLLLPVLVLVLVVETGCSFTRIARTEPDGTTFKALNARAFWKSQGIVVDYARTNTSVTAGARIDATASDAEAVKAAVEGAVQAGLKAATGR